MSTAWLVVGIATALGLVPVLVVVRRRRRAKELDDFFKGIPHSEILPLDWRGGSRSDPDKPVGFD